MTSVQPVISVRVIFQGNDVGVLLVDEVATKLTYKKLRLRVLDEFDDLPDILFRMKFNNGNIIDKSIEKNTFVEFQKENILELINVAETPNVFDGKSYKMGGVSIKETKRTSSMFQNNVHAIKNYDSLPFRFMFHIVLNSCRIFITGIFIYVLLEYVFLKTKSSPYSFPDRGVVLFNGNIGVRLYTLVQSILIAAILFYYVPYNLFILLKTNGHNIAAFKTFPIFLIPCLFLSIYIAIVVIIFVLNSISYVEADSKLYMLFVYTISPILFLCSNVFVFYKVRKEYNSNINLQVFKVFLMRMLLLYLGAYIFPLSTLYDDNSKFSRVAIILGLVLVREAVLSTLRLIAKNTSSENPASDISIIKFWLVFFSLYQRFLFFSMNSIELVTYSVVTNGFLELILRQSHGIIDQAIIQLAKQVVNCARFRHEVSNNKRREKFKSFRARYLIADMQCEFVTILATPCIIFCYSDARLFFDFGYVSLHRKLPILTLLYVFFFKFYSGNCGRFNVS